MLMDCTSICPTLVAQSYARPTNDQKVAGLIPAGSRNIFVVIDHEIFSMFFSPFCLFKKGSCQFLTKECA